MADNTRGGLGKLLNYIVDHQLMRTEREVAEVNATVVQDVDSEVGEISEDAHNAARRLNVAFARGLQQAAQSGGRLTVDDTDPTGNDIADAFARFLVTTNLATSQSTDTTEGHYRYTFEIDWPRLRQLAGEAGVDLDSAVREA